jgi:hypothetical protein
MLHPVQYDKTDKQIVESVLVWIRTVIRKTQVHGGGRGRLLETLPGKYAGQTIGFEALKK